MILNNLHAQILSKAFEHVLGVPDVGSMAYIRCLTGDILEALSIMDDFQPQGWKIKYVSDFIDDTRRTIAADYAVEIRESKGEPILLLVDTARAGAGMDSIFSATREVCEEELFSEAIRMAAHEITQKLSRDNRLFAEQAIKKARRRGKRVGLSRWAEFDFMVRCAFESAHPGVFLYLIGLWPLKHDDQIDDLEGLEVSLLFVNRLMGPASVTATPAARIEGLHLQNPTDTQRLELETFLHTAATKPLLTALTILADKPNLWVNALRVEQPSFIQNIEMIPWRTRAGQYARWSGLINTNPPRFVLRPDAEKTGQYSKIEVRWKTRPEMIKKGSVEYRIVVVTDMDEELTSRDVTHSAKDTEKCKFTNDDFSALGEDALIPAKIIVSVIGNENIVPVESEEFVICFGDPPETSKGGVGKKVRTFSEGLIEFADRDTVSAVASQDAVLSEDAKGYVVLRTKERGKTYRVFRPPLIREVEQQWSAENGAMGRWRVKLRASGRRAGSIEFVPFVKPDFSPGTLWDGSWSRAENATRRMADRLAISGGVAQMYDEQGKAFDLVKEYLLAWAALLESAQDPSFALVNTVEVQTLSGRTIGLIVLPTHPLRLAWHVAYDNLVFHSRFVQQLAPNDVRKELGILDGAMFPSFLPGLASGSTFVFADVLGFHAVGMVLDTDKEPKAAIALMARALGDTETADSSPMVGKQSAIVLGKEILKYLECHDGSKLLQIHGLRPGDGLTIARSLGEVRKNYRKIQETEGEDNEKVSPPAFVLELYPSEEQRGVAGRFIAEVGEKRRSGAGVVTDDDSWMFESRTLDAGLSLPSLRWARRDMETPDKPAHLAAAFDTFDSRVKALNESDLATKRPLMAFGLLSYFDRTYKSIPSPIWQSAIPQSSFRPYPYGPTITHSAITSQDGNTETGCRRFSCTSPPYRDFSG